MTVTQEALPTLDFATFVLSLSHSALMHLGEAPHPDDNEWHCSRSRSKQTSDLLGLLEEKTKGNLTGEEERLITQILFDLRMRFVEKSKSGK